MGELSSYIGGSTNGVTLASFVVWMQNQGFDVKQDSNGNYYSEGYLILEPVTVVAKKEPVEAEMDPPPVVAILRLLRMMHLGILTRQEAYCREVVGVAKVRLAGIKAEPVITGGRGITGPVMIMATLLTIILGAVMLDIMMWEVDIFTVIMSRDIIEMLSEMFL